MKKKQAPQNKRNYVRDIVLMLVAVAVIMVFAVSAMRGSSPVIGPPTAAAPAAAVPKVISVAPEPPLSPAPKQAVSDHFYVAKEGNQYGYATAAPEQQPKAGAVPPPMVTALYAGQRNGKYQVHSFVGQMISVAECAEPCEVIRLMTGIDGADGSISVRQVPADPKSLASRMLADARHGKLEPYTRTVDGRPSAMWFDDHQGLIPVRPAKAGTGTEAGAKR